ncbi:competence type IV pilus minor pilin ComGD [Pontibacillus salicampi]|uniref:Competence type IV pilus minor pilin ComGD n=1 Tax=Pontibacillus salicampi TaxID=1449801 RepID=A0ABV6LJZ3_9BACI
MNPPKQDKSSGFTFLEMLIVLAIMGVLLTISIPMTNRLQTSYKERMFLEQFKADVLLTQQQSMTTGDHYRIILYEQERYYRLYSENNHQLIQENHLPEDWILQSYTIDRKIQFDSNGRIRSPGTLFLRTPQSTYRIIFPLGKGRYYVKES